MTPAQYLAACKVKLGHISDYELAKRWEIDDGYMSKLKRGLRPINAHVAILIAITLELEPLKVLADIESQQQTGKVQAFWSGFLSRVSKLAGLGAATLLMLFGQDENALAASGGYKTSHNQERSQPAEGNGNQPTAVNTLWTAYLRGIAPNVHKT